MSEPITPAELDQIQRDVDAGMDRWALGGHVPKLLAEIRRLEGYEWALNMIEQLADKSQPDDDQMNPPWCLNLYFGDDADTMEVQGDSLLEVLLAYFEAMKSEPGEPDDTRVEGIRERLRALVADRQANINAAAKAFFEEQLAKQSAAT